MSGLPKKRYEYSPDGFAVYISEEQFRSNRLKYFELSDKTIVRVRDETGKVVMSFGYFTVPSEPVTTKTKPVNRVFKPTKTTKAMKAVKTGKADSKRVRKAARH